MMWLWITLAAIGWIGAGRAAARNWWDRTVEYNQAEADRLLYEDPAPVPMTGAVIVALLGPVYWLIVFGFVPAACAAGVAIRHFLIGERSNP